MGVNKTLTDLLELAEEKGDYVTVMNLLLDLSLALNVLSNENRQYSIEYTLAIDKVANVMNNVNDRRISYKEINDLVVMLRSSLPKIHTI